jgi:hypothetical protein
VDWFNAVDLTYRSELRDLNELNYARFEAKLDQKVAGLRAELFTGFRSELATQTRELEGRIDQLGSRMDRLELTLEKRLAEHVRFFFVAWAALMVPLVALLFQGARG